MSLWLDSRPLHGRRQGGSGEMSTRKVDVHMKWKPEREAEDKRIRKRGRRGRREEDGAVDQKQL